MPTDPSDPQTSPSLTRAQEAQEHAAWLDDVRAKLRELEAARGGEGSWSPALAVDAGLRYLAVLDTESLAASASAAFAERITDPAARVRFTAARAEALERIRAHAETASVGTFVTLHSVMPAAAQRDGLEILTRSATAVRTRAAVLSPNAERLLRQCPSPWDAEGGFPVDDAVLTALEMVNAGDAPVVLGAANIPDPSGEIREVEGHLARVAGSPLIAEPSHLTRTAIGVLNTLRASGLWDAARTEQATQRSQIERILKIATALHQARNPVAPLVVMVYAAATLPLGPRAFVQNSSDGTARVWRRVAQGLRVLSEAEPQHGARDLARRAVESLGYRFGDLTQAERTARSRAKAKRTGGRRG